MEDRDRAEGEKTGKGEIRSCKCQPCYPLKISHGRTLNIHTKHFQNQNKMGFQNQILQMIVDSNKNNNKINTRMKFINIEMLKSEKDDIKINEEDVITIQVTNDNTNNNISQKIEENILQNEKAQQRDIKEPAAQIVDMNTEKVEKTAIGKVSNKSLVEVVDAKAGRWNRQLFILNPDMEITSTIKQVKGKNKSESTTEGSNPAYILKAKKFAEPLLQSKKFAEKVRKSGRHFWDIWGNFGLFWVIFGPLWIILGHSRAILGHIWAI